MTCAAYTDLGLYLFKAAATVNASFNICNVGYYRQVHLFNEGGEIPKYVSIHTVYHV
jgi:hypothetical protein